MDWTPLLGRPRPVERDALRLVLLVRHLGVEDARPGGFRRFEGEERLLAFDHLVRHPATLLFTALDALARSNRKPSRPLVQSLRDLAGITGSKRFEKAPWERLDDALAWLTCRGLLRVEAGQSGEVVYVLGEEASRRLEDEILPRGAGLDDVMRRCRLLWDVLPGDATTGPQLEGSSGLEERLEAFRQEQQLEAGADLLSPLFRSVLGVVP